MEIKRIFIIVKGIVQGVGFRPFVYNLAVRLGLKGWVNNTSEGVQIDLEGARQDLYLFVRHLKQNPPVLSAIEEILVTEEETKGYSAFEIKESKKEAGSKKITLVSPDIAICKECLKDISEEQNRRYAYPFTNCTNCGPRYTIIKELPYDREKTTMKKFEMCSCCNWEYKDPTNRRFHAQPNACKECGPQIWIEDSIGNKIQAESALKWAAEKLKEGKIFAIKGLGGFHLACDGTNEKSIQTLRNRKNRPCKPFAVMMKNIDYVKEYCIVSKEEEKILTGSRKPIVILKVKSGVKLPINLVPNQNTLGVMLPYTPLHALLFQEDIGILVMTSANQKGLPLEYDNEGARKNLTAFVDFFLFHDREIYAPIDDSLVKVVDNKERIFRRARGYVPEPIRWENSKEILACGSNMKNTFCIAKEGFLFLSGYNGDLENIETYAHYKRNINHFFKLFLFQPKAIAHDMHPHYLSTEYAENWNIPRIPIQHHHAHIVSCMVENGVHQKILGIAYDGTGYGTDGTIWGGEFLICNLTEFERVGSLEKIQMPGGEKVIREPWRMGIAYLYKTWAEEKGRTENSAVSREEIIKNFFGERSKIILTMLEKDINCTWTSSIGRLFDAVSSILGIVHVSSYEGQAAIELEAKIDPSVKGSYPYRIRKKEAYSIQLTPMIYAVIKDIENGRSIEEISSKFHNTVIVFTLDLCLRIREEKNINHIALSGGVFQNEYILENLLLKLKGEGFIVYTHSRVPCNDEGVALGQIVIANERGKQ